MKKKFIVVVMEDEKGNVSSFSKNVGFEKGRISVDIHIKDIKK